MGFDGRVCRGLKNGYWIDEEEVIMIRKNFEILKMLIEFWPKFDLVCETMLELSVLIFLNNCSWEQSVSFLFEINADLNYKNFIRL